MRKLAPVILLVLGLGIIGYGFSEKDDSQATIDLGKTEIDIGKKDSAFNAYFLLGGVLAAAGLVMLVSGKQA